MWDSGDLQHWAHALGIGRPTGIDLPGAEEGLLPSQHWRNQLYKEGETERPWSAGRQRPARHRPGRPADQPAADGDRLRDARQRRHGRHPARRHADRRRRRPGAEGIRSQAAPARSHRPRIPGRDPRRAARRRAERRRDLVRGLRQLPDPGRRQDRDRAAPAAPGPVLVRRPRSLPESAYRHLRDHGGRRLRRRIGGARGEEDSRSVFRGPAREGSGLPKGAKG